MTIGTAKKELENLRSTTVKLLQNYEAYKAQYKSLAASQLELLGSDAFNIEVSKINPLVVNAAPAAKPVYENAAKEAEEKLAQETEDEMDETVSMEDDTMIKDIASIFD